MNQSNDNREIEERIEADRWLDRFETEKRGNPQLSLEEFLKQVPAGSLRIRVAGELEKLVPQVSGTDLEDVDTNIFDDAEFTSDADLEIGETVGQYIDNYKLLQVIGEGGMGTVFMAEQTQPVERRVALKIIKLGMDTKEVVARFEAERQALSMMDHPNIAKVLDVGTTENGRPYFVMELVKGLPFNRFCDERRLNIDERLSLFKAVCQGVQHAHHRGIIHRDLKPSNILITEYDHVAVPKIIDFGLAKAVDRRLTEKTMFTQMGQVVGTFSYMSPEQSKMNQLDVDTRTDIYSLGVILYEILTGTTPFDKKRLNSEALDRILQIIREEEPPIPSLRLSSVDSIPDVAASRKVEPKRLQGMIRGELDWIVMKALEKERSRRYETASSFAIDIQRYLEGEPVEAAPPSIAYKLRKFIRRNKSTVGAGMVVLATLIIGIIGTSIGMFRAQAAHQDALAAGEVANQATAKAEERLKTTREALDLMSGKMLNEWLLTRKEITEDQQAFLEQVINYYQFLAEETNQSPESILNVAQAYSRIGGIQNGLGRTEKAFEAYRNAEKILESISTDDSSTRSFYARTLREIGQLNKRTGKHDEAVEYFAKADPILDEVCALDPDDLGNLKERAYLDYLKAKLWIAQGKFDKGRELLEVVADAQRDLGRKFGKDRNVKLQLVSTLLELALETRYDDREKDAIAIYHEAIGISEKMVAEQPTNDRYRWQLSVLVNDLGILHKVKKRFELTLPLYERALKLRQRLHDEYPGVTEYTTLLAGSYLNLGNVNRILKKDDVAIDNYTKGIALCDENLARDPFDMRARMFNRNMHEGMAESKILAGDFGEALKHWDISIENYVEELKARNPAFSVRLPLRRAYVIAKLGDVVTAISLTESMMADVSDNHLAEASYCAASVFVAAFEQEKDELKKEEHAQKAVELIKASIENRKDLQNPRLTTWKDEPEFDPLREREDFKQLVNAKYKPKKEADENE